MEFSVFRSDLLKELELVQGAIESPTFPTFHLFGESATERGVIAERCPRFLSPVSGQAGGRQKEVGTLPGRPDALDQPADRAAEDLLPAGPGVGWRLAPARPPASFSAPGRP